MLYCFLKNWHPFACPFGVLQLIMSDFPEAGLVCGCLLFVEQNILISPVPKIIFFYDCAYLKKKGNS